MRELMIAEMRLEIRDPNGCSRYGRFFYIPKVVVTKHDRKFNARAVENNQIDLDTLETLDDSALLAAYRRYVQRWSTWM